MAVPVADRDYLQMIAEAVPVSWLPAAGRGFLRVSHAEREQVIGTLKAAFVHGMLSGAVLPGRHGRLMVAAAAAPSPLACRDGLQSPCDEPRITCPESRAADL